MPSFSQPSRERLLTCHPYLVRVATEVIKVYDFTIVCGHRSPEEQERLYAQGRTTPGDIVTWTLHSKHNETPSEAFDFCPWTPGIGLDWDNHVAFRAIAYSMLYVGRLWDWNLQWGGDWPAPKVDMPHIQISLN
jgi:hypothetical protein